MGQDCRADDGKIRWKQTPNLPIHESMIQRSAQKQKWWKIINTLLRRWGNDWNFFSPQLFLFISTVFTEQSQICVKNANPAMLEQGDLFWCDNLTHRLCQQVRWWKHLHVWPMILRKKIFCKSTKNDVDKLSQQNRVIQFCTDAGFLTTVDVGQHFMTKDTEEFSQFTDSVAFREYTLPRDEKSPEPKRWNTKIGPVLEVTTSYLQGKNGVEFRMESVNKDNSHSWVRIYHGLIKLVTELSNNKANDNNEQETSEMQFDNFALKSNARAFASRSKAKGKPTKTYSCQLIHNNFYPPQRKKFDRRWTTRIFALRLSRVEETDLSSSSWKSTSRQWWSDWTLENKGISSERSSTISTLVWWNCGRVQWKKAEEVGKDFNIVLIHQDKKFFISGLFNVIQDAISLILHYKTMC